jgi:hypothetical protein
LSKSRRSAQDESPARQDSEGAERTRTMGAAPVLELHAEPGTAILCELRAVRELLNAIDRRLFGEAVPTESPKRPEPALNDDAVVDQRSVLAPRDLYLRLARAKAFPSNKIGKRVLARWGDVRAALLGPSLRKVPSAAGTLEPHADGLDDLRDQLGLAKKDR